MTLGEMKQCLVSRQVRLTKALGQNFLHDGNQLRRIVSAAELTEQDQVLEIGPGLGPLTELLLAKASRVIAVEKDRRLVQLLSERFAGTPEFTLIHADALDYLQRDAFDWSDWKLVANLPYSVASSILVKLSCRETGPKRLVVTLQWEVAQRLMSKAGHADYGVLTLLVQLRYQPAGQFRIRASCFFPQPEVDSACVSLERRVAPLLTPAQAMKFTALVKCGFSQRRKMMFKLLKQDWPEEELTAAFAALHLSPQTRAEAVSLDQFVQLTRMLG